MASFAAVISIGLLATIWGVVDAGRLKRSTDVDFEENWVKIYCNNTVQHLNKKYYFSWSPSRARLDSKDSQNDYELEPYPAGTKCEVEFVIPAGEIMTVYMDMLNTVGSFENNCQDGDYVRFSVDGEAMESRRFCGHLDDLKEDIEPLYSEVSKKKAYQIEADPSVDRLVKAEFKGANGGRGGRVYSNDRSKLGEGFLFFIDILRPIPPMTLLPVVNRRG